LNNKDLFVHKSKSWDFKSRRVNSAKAIARTISENIRLDRSMHIMDFGAGTGLLSYFLSDKVAKITAIDTSTSMLKVFKEKSSLFKCPTEILNLDLTKDFKSNLLFDSIISSMTIHHIKDIEDMLKKMYNMLPNGGFIALADLDSEDGSFHSDNEGVFHFGFNRDKLKDIAQKVGFKMIKFETANIIKKPHKDFSVFLMSGVK